MLLLLHPTLLLLHPESSLLLQCSTYCSVVLIAKSTVMFTMYQEGLRSRRSLGRAMPSSDEKRQAQQVARRLKARQLKIQTLLEKLPGARQPATTIARPTPRDYSPPAALTLVPFRQSLTCCCTAAHESLSARMRSGHTLLCISLLHTYAYPVCNCPDYHRCSMLGQYDL